MSDIGSSHITRTGAPKQVLIVDDSRIMRAWLRTVLSGDERLVIAGEAGSAVEARDFIRSKPVDVVTLDIEMPGMSGLEFLTRLMRARPTPVVMLSSLTSQGSESAIQALSRGAIDCMVKPSDGFDQAVAHDICDRVFQAACTQPAILAGRPARSQPSQTAANISKIGQPCRRGAIILIGSSTGGVAALEEMLPMLDPAGPPVVIVQHMPGNFLASFSERLNKMLPQTVKLAEERTILARGDVVLAPGNGVHTEVRRHVSGWCCHFVANDPPALHCPSVDVLFRSAVPEGKSVTAVLLTGLGRDGAEGMLDLCHAGATTFGQNENTCVVYGMPRAAKALGAVQQELPLERIGAAIRSHRARQPGRASSATGTAS